MRHVLEGLRIIVKTPQEHAILKKALGAVEAARKEADPERRDAHCSIASQFCEALHSIAVNRLERENEEPRGKRESR